MAGLGLIVNSRCRLARRRPDAVARLVARLGPGDRAVVTSDLDDLAGRAAELAAAGVDTVAVCGGDGTIHNVVTALIAAWGDRPLPAIALLPGGTVNTVSRGIGVAGPGAAPERLLTDLVARRARGAAPAIAPRRVMRIGERHGFLFGNGIIHSFMEAYYAGPHPNAISAALLLSRITASALVGGPLSRRIVHRIAARITADGEPWAPRDYLLIACGTVPSIGLNFRVFPHCADRPDGFAALGIHTRPLGLISEMPNLQLGRRMRADRTITTTPRTLRIETDPPAGYMIDGDIYPAEPVVEVETGPLLDLIVPHPDDRR